MNKKRLLKEIEKTQEGAKFDDDPTDPVTEIISIAVASGETASEIADAIQYAIDQLTLARNVVNEF